MWVVFPPNLHTTTTVSVRLSYVKKNQRSGNKQLRMMVEKRSSAHQLRLLTSQVENFWSINKSSTVHQWNTLIDSRLNFFFWWRNLSHPNLPGVGEVLLIDGIWVIWYFTHLRRWVFSWRIALSCFWWKKSCTTCYLWNPVKHGILIIYELVQDSVHQQ